MRYLLLCLLVASGVSAGEPPLVDGDRVVFLGSTMVEREQRYGWWETALVTRFPDANVVFRNLGWSGDTVFGEARAGFGSPADGFKQLKDLTLELKPTRIVVCYGLNESFAGKDGLERFRKQYEVLLDALNQVTDSTTAFSGLPKDKNAPNRAVQLPDESFTSYFLDVFGRPQRQSACECERVSEANLAQVLHLLNSDEVQQKLTRVSGRADKLASAVDKRTEAEKITELFLWAYGRNPTKDDLKAALWHLAKHSANKKTAYENILWALVNSKEFIFNQ